MRLSRNLLKRLPYRVRMALHVDVPLQLAGQTLAIPCHAGVGLRNLDWQPSWKSALIAKLAQPARGVFVDVGANIGQTLLDVKLSHPRLGYVGFEPNPVCLSYLKALIHANHWTDCRLLPVALADAARCLPLYQHKDQLADAAGSIVPNLRPSRDYDIDYVPCLRFDELWPTLSLGPIGFVKVDVEGAELETLTGMQASLRESQPVILVEVLFTDSRGDMAVQTARNAQLMQLLQGLGYQVLQLRKSADLTTVAALEPITAFPQGYWSPQNKELCDYLCVPKAREDEVRSALMRT